MEKTKKILAIIAAFVFLGMGLNAYAGGAKAAGDKVGCEASAAIGRLVTTPDKEYLATIKDFVIDKGRVSLVILSHGGILGVGETLVAVPYNALSYESEGRTFTLNISKERFEAAPAFDRKMLTDRKWAADVYQYFGQQPYWTEEGWSKERPSGHEEYGPY
jgi:hypothetical protein